MESQQQPCYLQPSSRRVQTRVRTITVACSSFSSSIFCPNQKQRSVYVGLTVEIPSQPHQPVCAIFCTRPCHAETTGGRSHYFESLNGVLQSYSVLTAGDSFHLDNIICVPLLSFLSHFLSWLPEHRGYQGHLCSVLDCNNEFSPSFVNGCLKCVSTAAVTNTTVYVNRDKHVLCRCKPSASSPQQGSRFQFVIGKGDKFNRGGLGVKF